MDYKWKEENNKRNQWLHVIWSNDKQKIVEVRKSKKFQFET